MRTMLQIEDHGLNNEIDIAEDVLRAGTGLITLDGCNNRLVISSGSMLTNARIHLGAGSRVVVENSRIASCEIYCGAGASISIGKNCAFTWRTQVLAHESGCIRIGANCLFGTDTLVTLSDMHSIVDAASNARLNAARDVEIGEHVWVGFRALILKGGTVGDGAVIGAGSVVTGAIPAFSVAAGNPARVVRRETTWKAELI